MIDLHNSVGVRGAGRTSHGRPTRNKVRGILGFAAGIGLGLIGVGIGIFLLFLPPLGWILGPLVIIGSITLPVVLSVLGTMVVAGHCPYCGSSVLGLPSGESITCGACSKPIPIEAR